VLQYAVLAKSVKGLNDEICDELRGVILGGAALTIEANKEIKIKPPDSIVFLYFEDGCQELVMLRITLWRNSYISDPQSPLSILREQNADIQENVSHRLVK
jgi:hypothetical protein